MNNMQSRKKYVRYLFDLDERESGKGKEAKSEKVILEFREGNKLIN
jgi:hypothetical protein